MSMVLIMGPDEYRCSCGAKLAKADNSRGLCPVCGEKLERVIREAEYLESISKEKKTTKKRNAKNKKQS